MIGLRGELLYVSLLSILLHGPETDTPATFIRREKEKKCIFFTFFGENTPKAFIV